MMSNRVGQQLGNYRLIEVLGQGGFADVYLGEHVYLKTQAAIKVLRAILLKNDLESFLRESRAVANLIHPNIVRVLEFGVEGNTPFLVMDYAPNGTLRQRHPKGTRLQLQTVLTYVDQLAGALHFAHNRKVIHRDVKQENMLIGRNGEILVSDFGIAVVEQSSNYNAMQEIGGTVSYMAPEQLQGQASAASDQYALGIIIYEWLCGECPFRGTYFEIATQQIFTPPPPMHTKNVVIPSTVEQVLLKALNKDPQQRFDNVQSFANALEQAYERSDLLVFPSPLSYHNPLSQKCLPWPLLMASRHFFIEAFRGAPL
jgi:serine/threonine protein kinase